MNKPKRNFKSKGRVRNGAKVDREPKEGQFGTRVSKDNDPNWYLVNGQLAKDVANFSFNFATGGKIHLDPDISSGSGLNATNLRFPGICAIQTGPSIGVTEGLSSPINVAAKDIYSFVRHANSGHANYDTPDLMLYLLAADSVQTFWSYMVRACGVARIYSQTNKYVGDALLTAMGIDADDFRRNIAQFRAYVNQYAIKASVLAVPNTMTYYMRHQWMYQNVYMDEDNAKAQLFMYVPAYVYKYHINDTTTAGELIPFWVNASQNEHGVLSNRETLLTTGMLSSMGNELIDAMLSQEDVGIISGDILKAYGSDKLYRYAQIDENYAIAPVYSEEVLAQFHNTDFTGNYIGALYNDNDTVKVITDPDLALTISQVLGIGGGQISCTPYVVAAPHLTYNKFLDFWKGDVQPEDCIVASRNKIHTSLVNFPVLTKKKINFAGVSCAALESCGSELCINAYVYTYDRITGVLVAVGTCAVTGTANAYNPAVLSLASKFNQYPLLHSVTAGMINLPVGEMSNFTMLSGSEVGALHNTALLSMFGVPYHW